MTQFFPADHEPELSHEHQFVLDKADGQAAFERIVGFIGDRVRD